MRRQLGESDTRWTTFQTGRHPSVYHADPKWVVRCSLYMEFGGLMLLPDLRQFTSDIDHPVRNPEKGIAAN